MKKTRYLITQIVVIVLAFQISIKAQTTNPPAPAVWLKADNMGLDPKIWQDISGNTNHAYATSSLAIVPTINFNPSVDLFGYIDSLAIQYTHANKDYFKVFTVFKSLDQSNDEQFIWRFGNKLNHSLQLSNKKLYDVPKIYKYAGGNISHAVISIVDKYSSSSEAQQGALYLGSTIQDSLHTGFFKGQIAELIVYDQEISRETHNSIASYLAIKYGVSLFDLNYLNSHGNIIWDKSENIQYFHNLFAIGRDMGFNLNQKQAESASSPVLTISAGEFHPDNNGNPYQLEENSFMFFADNDVAPNVAVSVPAKEGGSYYISKKRWKVSVHGDNIYRTPLGMKVKINELFDENIEGFRLIADTKKDGSFTEIKVITPDSISSDSCAHFSNLRWCSSSSNNDYFTFAITSPLELDANYQPPACKGALGKLHINISGGNAPYTYILLNKSNDTLKTWVSSLPKQTIDSLPEGEYGVSVIDNSAYKYSLETGERLYVEFPNLQLNSIYSYTGTPVKLDVCFINNIDVESYTWSKDEEPISDDCFIELSEEGVYKLLVTTTQACRISHELYVADKTGGTDGTTSMDTNTENNQAVKLSPNPTTGKYKLVFSLDQYQDVNLYISNTSGGNIGKYELKNIMDYTFEDEIIRPGVYLLTVFGKNNILFSQKLIVE